jgi:hypothetical protein
LVYEGCRSAEAAVSFDFDDNSAYLPAIMNNPSRGLRLSPLRRALLYQQGHGSLLRIGSIFDTMNEPIPLPVEHLGVGYEFPLTLIQLGYTYQLHIEVNGQVLIFEKDDAGQYRVVGNAGSEGLIYSFRWSSALQFRPLNCSKPLQSLKVQPLWLMQPVRLPLGKRQPIQVPRDIYYSLAIVQKSLRWRLD